MELVSVLTMRRRSGKEEPVRYSRPFPLIGPLIGDDAVFHGCDVTWKLCPSRSGTPVKPSPLSGSTLGTWPWSSKKPTRRSTTTARRGNCQRSSRTWSRTRCTPTGHTSPTRRVPWSWQTNSVTLAVFTLAYNRDVSSGINDGGPAILGAV